MHVLLTPEVRGAALPLAGITCLVVAAFLLHPIAGWAALGVALLTLEFLTSPSNERTERRIPDPSRR